MEIFTIVLIVVIVVLAVYYFSQKKKGQKAVGPTDEQTPLSPEPEVPETPEETKDEPRV